MINVVLCLLLFYTNKPNVFSIIINEIDSETKSITLVEGILVY